MNKKILLVEGNQDDAAEIVESLRSQDITDEVIVLREGQQALDYLFSKDEYQGRDIQDQPAVILLSLHIAKVAGIDTLKRIRASKKMKHIPILVLTDSPDELEKSRCYKNGANGYISKSKTKPLYPLCHSELKNYA